MNIKKILLLLAYVCRGERNCIEKHTFLRFEGFEEVLNEAAWFGHGFSQTHEKVAELDWIGLDWIMRFLDCEREDCIGYEVSL